MTTAKQLENWRRLAVDCEMPASADTYDVPAAARKAFAHMHTALERERERAAQAEQERDALAEKWASVPWALILDVIARSACDRRLAAWVVMRRPPPRE